MKKKIGFAIAICITLAQLSMKMSDLISYLEQY